MVAIYRDFRVAWSFANRSIEGNGAL